MVYRLKLKQDADGTVYLQLGWVWRAFFLLVTLVVAVAIVQDGAVRGLLPVLGVLSLFATLYYERWTFDRKRDVITSRVGVVFYAPVRRYPFSALRAVRVRSSVPWQPDLRPERASLVRMTPRGYVQLLLELSEGAESPARPVVQTESLRGRDTLITLAQQLSVALGVPLEVS